MARHPYPMTHVRLRTPLLLGQVHAALEEAAKPQEAPPADDTTDAPAAKRGGGAGGGLLNLKGVVAGLLPYGPGIAEHVVRTAGLDPNRQPGRQPLGADEVAALFGGVQQLEGWFRGLEEGAPAGYIGQQERPPQQGGGEDGAEPAPAAGPGGDEGPGARQASGGGGAAAAGGEGGGGAEGDGEGDGAPVVYEDFNPLRLAQCAGESVLEFPSFDDALDEFYSKIEGQRVDVAKADAEKAAVGKLERVKQDQGARVAALESEASEAELRATLIEYNLGEVDAAIDAVNAAVASGMDWRELDAMIREERRAGNPVAGLIHSLQLDSNRVTLLLQNNLDEEDDSEEAQTRPATKVPVDLSLSAYANARQHHESRKRQLQKRDKTLAANEAAFKAAEKKAAAQLANLRNNASTAQVVRKAAWYERFHWFVSSENYLVISGRDAQQNEMIVKRYFRKGDAYVHAELHGASSTVVRNNDPSKPLPPLTLQQAGCACVCRSRAWDQKVVTSAYWVHHHQVSKAAPTGEYLPTGSFMIRGKKNYLPPQPLVFGFGFMFKSRGSPFSPRRTPPAFYPQVA
ncbi:hypothetical protein MNEG_13027 [Monoraphidium neglectum]|uniref:NFACT RNA-binding domain-containing protein n=1 Tax=Monoraphidium neglectum TaxID=145388 RepID=A0A0D2MIV3_9CHLO|nr:hypothetical protein MNEG_13027 [Monoraphidium neglectum]KIY94935.1 hypothetical protein MNEG_13027 [Monoraphidium neglectum]|eukprot:XP_013893955.1 hypothetical protein MNEG_13027 [Monoraphidium neglectum]